MKSSKVESERIWDGLILVAGLEGNKMIASEGIDERRIGGGRVAGNSQIMRGLPFIRRPKADYIEIKIK